MVVVYVFVALAIAFAIAAIVIGREARRLDAVPPRPVFDLDEAVVYVADTLPFDVTAELSHDQVRRIIEWSLEFFRMKGVSGNGGSGMPAGPVVVGGAETVDYVLARARAGGEDLGAAHVHAVLDAHMAYLEAIGAIGPEVPPGDMEKGV